MDVSIAIDTTLYDASAVNRAEGTWLLKGLRMQAMWCGVSSIESL
jgi:hypothetical protein